MVCLQVCKAHLDLLALVTGFGELGRAHQRTGVIASSLVLIAHDFACRCVRTTLRLERAELAVAFARAVAQDVVGPDAARGREHLAGRTDIKVAVAVESE